MEMACLPGSRDSGFIGLDLVLADNADRDHCHPRAARQPRISRALHLLTDDLKQSTTRLPGDRRPITYHPAQA